MTIDLAASIRTALIGEASVVDEISEWNGEPSVHTRTNVPDSVLYPLIIIESIDVSDRDGLVSRISIIEWVVKIYGRKDNDYRSVEKAGYAVRALFHRQRFAITHDDVTIIQITCHGPMPAPAEDDSLVGRLVTLQITVEE